MEKTMTTALTWIPRGVAKSNPEKHKMTEEDWERIQDEFGGDEPEEAQEVNTDGLKEFNMDNFDDEDGEDNEAGMQFFTTVENDQAAIAKDKYLGDAGHDSEEEEDNTIKPDDMLICCASVEEEQCSLEVYVYEEDNAHMYLHHDILLGAYPLCLEWVNTCKNERGNYCAIGSFSNTIDIWNLDLLEVTTPCGQLGVSERSKKKKKSTTSHSAPVLALSRNLAQQHVLASGSADSTVKLWDINMEKCLETFTHHTDKIQCVRFHPAEHSVLLTAAFDKTVAIMDVRQGSKAAIKTKLTADAEHASWSVQNPMQCFVSSEDGTVKCLDVRNIANGELAEVWSIRAHDNACTSVVDGGVKNMMITSSVDSTAKIWDLSSGTPKLAFSRDLQVGPLFNCQISPDAPTIASFGGNQPVVWDLRDTELLTSVFNI